MGWRDIFKSKRSWQRNGGGSDKVVSRGKRCGILRRIRAYLTCVHLAGVLGPNYLRYRTTPHVARGALAGRMTGGLCGHHTLDEGGLMICHCLEVFYEVLNSVEVLGAGE